MRWRYSGVPTPCWVTAPPLTAIEHDEQLGGAQDLGNMVITHGVRPGLALSGGDSLAPQRWAQSAVNHVCGMTTSSTTHVRDSTSPRPIRS
jgi:hypothetical protein